MGDKFGAFLLGILFAGILAAVVQSWWPSYTTLYELGQRDALAGKIVWNLVKQDDGTTKWEHK